MLWHAYSGTNSSSWSTDGVETRIMAYNESTQSYVVECLSDHLTSFAVLMDVNDALGVSIMSGVYESCNYWGG